MCWHVYVWSVLWIAKTAGQWFATKKIPSLEMISPQSDFPVRNKILGWKHFFSHQWFATPINSILMYAWLELFFLRRFLWFLSIQLSMRSICPNLLHSSKPGWKEGLTQRSFVQNDLILKIFKNLVWFVGTVWHMFNFLLFGNFHRYTALKREPNRTEASTHWQPYCLWR